MLTSTEDQRIDRELRREESASDPFAAAMRATRMSMLITDPRQHDNPIVFVNEAFLRLTGYSREEVLGRNCRFLQGPETDRAAVARMRDAIARSAPIEIELLNYRKDATPFWNRVLISPVFDAGKVTYFSASQLDVSPERHQVHRLTADQNLLQAELQRRVQELAASEERFKFTLKAAGLGTWTLDLATRTLLASAICKENFGRMPGDAFTYDDLQQAIVAEDFPHWKATVERALANDGILDVRYRARTPSNEIRWIEVRAQTSYDRAGRPIAMSGISMDITAQKQLEEHRALLTNEMGHRIKNILANVQGIVRQSLRGGTTTADAERTIAERIEALATAQDLLLAEKFGPVRFANVVEESVALFSAYQGRIGSRGPADLRVLPTVASAIAMALHELATNAVKHGALSNDRGMVEIQWNTHGGMFEMAWTESGGPPVTAPSRRGFGSRLIVQGLSSALSGQVEMNYLESGLRANIKAPVDKVIAC